MTDQVTNSGTDLDTLRARCEAAGWTMKRTGTFTWDIIPPHNVICPFHLVISDSERILDESIAVADAVIDWHKRWNECKRCGGRRYVHVPETIKIMTHEGGYTKTERYERCPDCRVPPGVGDE